MLAAVFMLLHAAVIGVVPLADAQLEQTADFTVHIESGDRPCPQHDHLQCQLCRLAGANVLVAADAERLTEPVAWTVPSVAAEYFHFVSAEPWLPLGARAPPIV